MTLDQLAILRLASMFDGAWHCMAQHHQNMVQPEWRFMYAMHRRR